MSLWMMKFDVSTRLRNRRIGLSLAVAALLYFAAVIAFIIVY